MHEPIMQLNRDLPKRIEFLGSVCEQKFYYSIYV